MGVLSDIGGKLQETIGENQERNAFKAERYRKIYPDY